MKNKLLWFIILVLLALFIPLVQYDNEIQQGVTSVEYKNVFSILKERYEKAQNRRVGVVSSEVPEVSGKGLDTDGQHVQ